MYNVVQYSSKEYRGYKAGEYTCGSIVVNCLGACNGMIFNQCPCDGFNASIGKCGYSVAYSAPVECKTGNDARIIGNLKRIIGSFLGNKRIE